MDNFEAGTVVRLKKTGELAVIRQLFYLKDGMNFLHYLGEIEGRRRGLYALYHDDVELECLPVNQSN